MQRSAFPAFALCPSLRMPIMDQVQTVVVGSGVVGIAIARKLARNGHDVLVLEAEDSGFHHTSARNSQVMHAGMFYEPGSLKARFCAKGQRMLYDFCETRHVDHIRCGKLIIAAQTEQLATLHSLQSRGIENGVDDLRVLTAQGAMVMEPELWCAGALLSPSTGTLDAPSLMRAMQGEAEADGAMFAYTAPLLAAQLKARDFHLTVGGEQAMQITCRNLINAAGLGAWDVARNIDAIRPDTIPTQTFAKAGYFSLTTGTSPFEHLIYPAPNSVPAGVHALRDVAGQARFGPSASFVDPPEIDYRHDAEPEAFEAAIRNFWPAMPVGCLQPDTTGIRPRITKPGAVLADFRIDGPLSHGLAGLVQLFGIESPGLTSSLAIADYVADQL
jgi:L-2-hydroxyglutarate oxidase LhgO